MKFEIYKAKDGWRWRCRARNGRITACSGEAFASKWNTKRAVLDFVDNVAWTVLHDAIIDEKA